MKKKISRRYVYIFAGVAALIALLLWVYPIAFIKTGILTKEKVDQYEKQYDLGAARKFDANGRWMPDWPLRIWRLWQRHWDWARYIMDIWQGLRMLILN